MLPSIFHMTPEPATPRRAWLAAQKGSPLLPACLACLLRPCLCVHARACRSSQAGGLQLLHAALLALADLRHRPPDATLAALLELWQAQVQERLAGPGVGALQDPRTPAANTNKPGAHGAAPGGRSAWRSHTLVLVAARLHELTGGELQLPAVVCNAVAAALEEDASR